MLNRRAMKILNKYKIQPNSDANKPNLNNINTDIKVDEEVETNLKIQLPQDHSTHKISEENILEELRNVNENYPLITSNMNGQNMVIASAHIFFDNEQF